MHFSDFGDLQLKLEEETQDVLVPESWAVSEDGSLRHNKTGISIGELGVLDARVSDHLESLTRINPQDIEVDQTNLLGRGAGGVVARGKHRPSNTPLAVKIVRVEDKAKRSQLINDLHCLLRMTESSFLIQLYAAYVHKDTGCVHVALEFMDYGSLQDLKSKIDKVPPNMLAIILMQILEGLKVLHLNYVLHRDVKLGNILVNSRGAVKVTDFGISKKLDNGVMVDTFVGTATHMSPERVLGEDYSFPADIWSLGLIAYELASGKYPYGEIASFPVLFDNLCNKPEPVLPQSGYPPEVCDFVKRCLVRKPDKRATAIQLQAHPFIINSMYEVTQKQLIRWLREIMSVDSW